MSFSRTNDKEFVNKLTLLILENLEDENFGTEKLVQLTGMSRYGLNKKLHSINNKFISRFIHEVRLQKALEMLQYEEVTASEVSYKVGFSSPAYFTKCFHEFFGYPPGKVKRVNPESLEGNIQTTEILKQETKKSSRQNLLFTGSIGILLFVLITIIALLVSPKIFRQNTLDDLRSPDGRISVAIMPFQNMTNNTSWNIWQDGLQTSLISSLANSREIKVFQAGSINNLLESEGITDYASITASVASAISKRLDANVFIYGNIMPAGERMRINSLIINSRTNEVFKSIQKEGFEDDIMLTIDTLSQELNDYLIISKLRKADVHNTYYSLPKSAEAYKYIISGARSYHKLDYYASIDSWMQAVKIDSNLVDALSGIANSYFNQGDIEQGKKWLIRFYSKLDRMDFYNKLYANQLYTYYLKSPDEAAKYAKQMIDMNDLSPANYYNLGDIYFQAHQYGKAIPAYEKAIEIFHKWRAKPFWVLAYSELGICYHNTGQYNKERRLYRNAAKDFPDHPLLTARNAILSLTKGDTTKANQYIKKYISIRRDNAWSEANIANDLAIFYTEAFPDKAEGYYRKALSLEPENPVRMSNLAYFLIDHGRNINEGIELIDRALKLKPEHYNFLDYKGWGLFKQGKNKEALALLEKADSLKPIYNYRLHYHLEEVKKGVAIHN